MPGGVTKLIANAFAAGLLSNALADNVNIVNADMLAQERGIEIKRDCRRIDITSVIASHMNGDRGICAITRCRDRRVFSIRKHARPKHYGVLRVRESVCCRHEAEQNHNAEFSHRFPHEF